MNRGSSIILVLLILLSCTAYKQLQPKPELISDEKGYVELKKGKNDFELKKDKKYFIQFPSAQDQNFYLVLKLPQKKVFNGFLTSQLTNNKKYGEKIPDESSTDSMSIYPIGNNGTGYFFLIDHISNDVMLHIDYRYTPQWRFKFENKYASFKETLERNRVDRSRYNSIGGGHHLDDVNFPLAIDTITKRSSNLQPVYKELLSIQSIFPAKIVNSTDAAYLNYVDLKKNLEDEIAFQDNYLSVLDFFSKEYTCRGNPSEFLKAVEDFIGYFTKKDRLPTTIVTESQNVLNGRLSEITPFYDQRISGKEDSKPMDQNLYMLKQLYRIGTLYQTSGLTEASEYSNLVKFTKDFDARSISFANVKDSLNKINESVRKSTDMPNDDFFRSIVARTASIQQSIPPQLDESYGKYVSFRCVNALNSEIAGFASQIEKILGQYREAEALVPQLNSYKLQKDYSSMLGMLKQNLHLAFLIDKYSQLDKLSIEEQSEGIEAALNSQEWASGEDKLRKLFQDQNFLNLGEAAAIKSSAVNRLEDSLYIKIDRVSRNHIDKFLEDNINTLENVDSLYSDSIFMPVYNITFSSGNRNELIQRKNDLIAHLAKLKEDEFPAKAIKLLYDQFTANPGDNGVLKARAIVIHGDHYKGDDKKIKQRVAECDPYTAKWITKPKEYRRVFVLPVTDNRHGKNKYVVRFNIDIPTEANFPVYDVNIKLPKEVGGNAASEQWYESITLNKQPLKNEGRFSITAPSAMNDYECQITPVQMSKDQKNVLEIIFHHQSFKVHALSVMVQKPIIKKN